MSCAFMWSCYFLSVGLPVSDKPPPYPDTQQQPAYPQQLGYPPQPAPGPGYSQPTAAGYVTITVVQQPTTVVIAPTPFHESPVSLSCPSCRATIVTGTQYVTGTLTWLACFGLCIIG